MAATAAAVLSACGGDDASKSTQAVARVNDREISIHQLNFVAQRLPSNLPQERIGEARRTILQGLIEQETLVQFALQQRIDRDAQVHQQLEAARREILVRAALDRIAAQSPRPDADEVRKFFAENPGLFSRRRVFRFDEIMLPGTPVDWPRLEQQLANARTLRDAGAVLKGRGLDLPVAQGVLRATESMPLASLPALMQKKVGDLVVWRQPPRIVIGQIIEVRDAPVEEAKAQPVIEQYLANRKRQEAVAAELKRLNETAKVAYLGEFAALAPDAAAAASRAPAAGGATAGGATAGAPAVTSGAGPGSRAPGAPDSEGAAAVDSAVAKGVAGLR